MSSERDLTTPTARVGWAIDRMRDQGVVLEVLAEQIGCTHSTLSLWQGGGTNVLNAKAGLLANFAQATGVSLYWLLTGQGQRIDAYKSSALIEHLTSRLQAMERDSPDGLAVVAKMIEAASASDKPQS